ncbi:TonB-dependent receptor plug domain-containing protein [Helicobacter zhangjianzhongii]|uniref:TonB-dependent receptor plug domain-containing protein n=1 Tax=Helicobacter zhangjianzhongii TaxID=2974574 RepID=A0ACC6FTV7_9HELI|nr:MULTISPECIES: TonB-dependent receptor plug domain-containing protein [unclassified Helicobacter]MDL0080756.1 TonB-dependent receptor plug domain-containing protein [Helicobacter sp. CPD2-1]MDL0082719.1 TonB-dependent receptor plug domain-containing protein [Helicobacter sp. XJK30-2]
MRSTMLFATSFATLLIVAVPLCADTRSKRDETKPETKTIVDSSGALDSTKELESSPSDKAERVYKLSPVYAAAVRTPIQSTQTLEGKDALLHSGDIAKSLLYVPGFSTMRKGGLGSEVIFRSQGAGRVPISLDGSNLHGACGGRMDTTATYIFPENYHRILLIKGPQDVRFGALVSGGVVFMRDITALSANTLQADTSMLAGSFNRLDLHASALAGGKYGSLQAIASHYESGDYRTGSASSHKLGASTHTAYKRESASLIATFTPSKYTGIELDMDIGRGFSSYQDRSMDARTFDRLSFSLKAQHEFQNDIIKKLDLRASWHRVDHIMDNFSHRQVIDGIYKLNNPQRTNANARAELTLYPSQALTLYLGTSYAYDDHQMRSSGDVNSTAAANAILSASYKPNFHFNYASIFAQGSYAQLDSASSVYFGARYDYAQAYQASNAQVASDHLGSGFVRYQYQKDGFSYLVGLGSAQRSADFWERGKMGGMSLAPETNLQLDIAALYQVDSLYIQASVYSAYMWDYIALHYGVNTSAFNTNALLAGAELQAKYGLFDFLYMSGSLAYTYGQNLTTKSGLLAGAPLPQVAPLQAQVSLWLEYRGFLARADVFANAAQSRYAKDYGNVIGKDFGASLGFATLSIYGGYKRKNFSLLCGIENLTNTLYSYHLSKAGVMIGDLAPVSRIYEPGRSYYVKLTLGF